MTQSDYIAGIQQTDDPAKILELMHRAARDMGISANEFIDIVEVGVNRRSELGAYQR